MAEDVARALEDASHARALGAEIVEFRVDTLFQGEGDDEGAAAVLRLVRESPLPCIVTCRAAAEGGDYDGDDSARISLYEALGTCETPPAYVDLELATFERSANLRQKVRLGVVHPGQQKDLSTRLILSAHDFDGRPSDLTRRVGAMASEDAVAVSKIAFRARSLRDNLELFELLTEGHKPTIALGMGRFGLMSRVLAPKFGGFLTFAALREEAATAPGQPTVGELTSTYRFRSIGAQTRVYGVVGWPAEHSIGPHVHNAGFESVGHDGVYLPLPVGPEWEDFKATLLALTDDPRLDFSGCSVTMPHKEHALRLAREEGWSIDASAEACGAANTLALVEGGWRVANTDVVGVTSPLERTLAGGLGGARVLVVGAGGAARAAAWGCDQRGARVTIAARKDERARALADELGAESAAMSALGDHAWDAVVHATPAGMAGGEAEDACAIELSVLDAWASCASPPVIFETVYTPADTPLVRACVARGLRTIPGVLMFVAQGAAQFTMWTGTDAPEGVMTRVAEEALAGPSD